MTLTAIYKLMLGDLQDTNYFHLKTLEPSNKKQKLLINTMSADHMVTRTFELRSQPVAYVHIFSIISNILAKHATIYFTTSETTCNEQSLKSLLCARYQDSRCLYMFIMQMEINPTKLTRISSKRMLEKRKLY